MQVPLVAGVKARRPVTAGDSDSGPALTQAPRCPISDLRRGTSGNSSWGRAHRGRRRPLPREPPPRRPVSRRELPDQPALLLRRPSSGCWPTGRCLSRPRAERRPRRRAVGRTAPRRGPPTRGWRESMSGRPRPRPRRRSGSTRCCGDYTARPIAARGRLRQSEGLRTDRRRAVPGFGDKLTRAVIHLRLATQVASGSTRRRTGRRPARPPGERPHWRR